MDTLLNTQSNDAMVMLFCSLTIITIATLICITTFRLTRPERYLYRMTTEIETMQENFIAASRYHLEVAATLAYLDQIKERPELMDRLAQTSREVLTASLLQRMSLIAGTLVVMHKSLEEAEIDYASYSSNHAKNHISSIRKEISKLQTDQQALHQLCELHGGVASAAR